jgi:malonyl-CoA decarboxylase
LLRREFPGLETFVTLSPIPRFRKWLEAKLQQNEHDNPFYDDTLLSDDDISKLAKIQPWTGSRPPNPHEALSILLECIDTQKGIQDNTEIVEPILMKLTARYLVLEKHRRKPLDGVGRFHVGNGAEVFRVNFAADFSRKGLLNSFGMMVNYQYNLPILAENQKNFEETYHMSVSPQVSQWIAPMANGERSKL